MSDTTISKIMKENGNAAIIIVFCKAVNPLTESKISAMEDWMTPQMIFTLFGGVKEPYVDCMPNTNVAESADVTKKEAMSKMAIKEMKKDHGIVPNISNTTSSMEDFDKSTIPSFCAVIAVVPNEENQIVHNNVGANNTPIMNSRIVRPFDTRAMNILTNGAQEIHHAQ